MSIGLQWGPLVEDFSIANFSIPFNPLVLIFVNSFNNFFSSDDYSAFHTKIFFVLCLKPFQAVKSNS